MQSAQATPIILANGEIHDDIIANGAEMLRSGASGADVAEQIARDVEDDPHEHTVGYGGWPNILGEVELDASFMDGAALKAGAVAALKGFRHPISVARQVAHRLPHVLLAGEGAARFADEIGAERRDMLSPEARQGWLDHLSRLGLTDMADVTDVKTLLLDHAQDAPGLIGLVNRATRWREGSDTMNVIVRDARGNIASAVSTSGVAWKYPGRVGDSPVIGAGNYADNRYGAAACMGWGEVTMRTSAARVAVMRMQMGDVLHEAGQAVVGEMCGLCEDGQWVRILIMDAQGNVGGFATKPGLTFKVQTVNDAQPRVMEAQTPR